MNATNFWSPTIHPINENWTTFARRTSSSPTPSPITKATSAPRLRNCSRQKGSWPSQRPWSRVWGWNREVWDRERRRRGPCMRICWENRRVRTYCWWTYRWLSTDTIKYMYMYVCACVYMCRVQDLHVRSSRGGGEGEQIHVLNAKIYSGGHIHVHVYKRWLDMYMYVQLSNL